MLNNLRKSIISSTKDIVSDRLYYSEAPANTAFPYITFHFITNTNEKDTGSNFEQVRVQFSLFDNDTKPDRLETLISELKNIYDNSAGKLTISGKHLFIYVERQSVRPPRKIEGVWQATTDYILEIETL